MLICNFCNNNCYNNINNIVITTIGIITIRNMVTFDTVEFVMRDQQFTVYNHWQNVFNLKVFGLATR